MPTRIVEWTAADGTRLAATVRGPDTPGALPVLCLPGLTRNGRDFAALAEALSTGPTGRRTICMDFRGRGLSGWTDPATYRPDVEANDTIAGLDHLDLAKVAVVGTSRGGIVAMLLAAMAGDRVGPMVLNDIGPVIERAGLIAIRDRMQGTVGAPLPDFDAAARALRRFLEADFPALTETDWLRLARQTHREDSDGRPILDYDPALAAAFGGFDLEQGLPPFWPAYDALGDRPILVVRGENSDILAEQTVTEMVGRLPRVSVHRVRDEGHAPLLWDAPTIARIAAFLTP